MYTEKVMHIEQNVPLAPFTSFKTGGPAANFVLVKNTDELLEVLRGTDLKPIWLLGFGSNTLISDQGLPGLTIVMRGGKIEREGERIIADAGVWWDSIVQTAIGHNLWGIELLSEVPGSFGAAIFINITAYGQSVGPVLDWVEVWDPNQQSLRRIMKDALSWDYKVSIFQRSENRDLIILRAALSLSSTMTEQLQYQKALDVAAELSLDANDLRSRRQIVIEARKRAGSLWSPEEGAKSAKTVGSFFRNPVVDGHQAELVMHFDESGKTRDEIIRMNTVHGGNRKRVSAAHVMLAAGYKRGQIWGHVKLNDQNLLKIEALEGATAQELYNVAEEIKATCQEKLGITLEPEARILGAFN